MDLIAQKYEIDVLSILIMDTVPGNMFALHMAPQICSEFHFWYNHWDFLYNLLYP